MQATIETATLLNHPGTAPYATETASGNRSGNQSRITRGGEHLFRTGDPIRFLYRVIAGTFKSYYIHENGDEQVIGFYMPGDLVGCEALADGCAAFSVVALDTANVQRLGPIPNEETLRDAPIGNRDMVAELQKEVLRLARLLHMERGGTDQRLATFLLDYAKAQAERGYSGREFRLPMCRRDLARYIGLAPETVSRIFTRLRSAGILKVDNNHVVILDHEALADVAQQRAHLPDRQTA